VSALGGTDPLAPLSQRERQLLALMAMGRSNAAICHELWLSPKTVESHVRSIFAKLRVTQNGAHRRVAAVLLYLEATEPDHRAA
jgi:serine/threonine-protein kinase PknK